MKTVFRLTIATALLTLAFILISCNKNSGGDPYDTITISEYELPEGYQWKNVAKNKLHIIKSEDTLSEYIDTEKETLPQINFTKEVIYLVCGDSDYGIEKITTFLNKQGTRYYFHVMIDQSDKKKSTPWQTAAIVSAYEEKNPGNVELYIVKSQEQKNPPTEQ